jgi:hypothetical protein
LVRRGLESLRFGYPASRPAAESDPDGHKRSRVHERREKNTLSFASFGLTAEQLDVTRIEPKATESGQVLTEREIANQEIETFKKQEEAQDQRVATEAATGKADMQKDLARSEVGITIADNNASAKTAEGRGLASYTKQTGEAQADVIKAPGLARAAGASSYWGTPPAEYFAPSRSLIISWMYGFSFKLA